MTISNNTDRPNKMNNQDVYVFPTSFGQKRLWFLDQFEPGSPYYNIPLAFRLKGKFDDTVFLKTINTIVKRHESLRTAFEISNGEPVQVIYPEIDVKIHRIDLSSLLEKNIENKINEIASSEARKGFELNKVPLFRITVIKVNDFDHVILMTFHHIISDGWSMSILVSEITQIYSSIETHSSIPLGTLEIQYADFTEWQKELFKNGVFDKQLQYWMNKLSNSNSHLELPIDFNRPDVWTNNGSSISRILGKEIIEGINKINIESGTTLFMFLFTCFAILLSKLTGEEDINVGTPIANRTNQNLEKIIGLFINTLVLRTDLSGNPSFLELLQKVKILTLEAYENQDVPFEYLVEKLQPEREMSYAPLYQVMFILQNNPVSKFELKDIQLSMLKVDMGTSTSDLTFSIAPGLYGLSCDIEFNTDLFKESTIHRFFNYYSQLLKRVIENPSLKINDITIIDEFEQNLVTQTWNSNKLEYNNKLCIHHLFEKWVSTIPDNSAVVFQEKRIDYFNLNYKANQIADFLIKNFPSTKIVGICLNKSIELLISVLGVLKSGKAYLPIDPTYPKDRIEYMIDDSKLKLIISDHSNINLFTITKLNFLLIDDWRIFKDYSSENPNIEINPSSLAYVIYTSGSTGKAKGTMIQHNSLVNIYLGWEKEYTLLNIAKNHLQMASFSFDVFGGDWTRALCSGGKLVLVPRELLLEAEQLYNLMIKENITIAEFVPAVLRNLIEYVEQNNLSLDFFKILIAGSDIWYVKEYKKFLSFCGKETRLINSFGLTETAIDSTYFESVELNFPDDKLVPIGKPFPNIRIYILDKYLNPQPIGVKGELYVAGISVARGYLFRAELTAEKFLPDPFSLSPGERMYKTGDVAKYLSDGNIEFLGRADNQVKLRGFRIELGEIESAIGDYPNIKDGIVILKEIGQDKKILAYFTTVLGEDIDIIKLRDFLLEKLPDYMIPSSFQKLDSFPLTPNGKIDRKNLPVPDEESLSKIIRAEYIAPRNNIEEVIANIWCDILNLKLVSIFDNFFILGGHSLLATQVISRIKTAFETDIPLRTIFEFPTIAGLSKIISEKCSQEIGVTLPEIEPRTDNTNVPLSFSQQRLWFLDQLEPNSPYYNMPENYLLEGALDLNVFENSVNQLVKRHEILRTQFEVENEIPYQIILDDLEINVNIIDFSYKKRDTIDNEIQEYLANEAAIPFNLSKCPLFRIKLIQLNEKKYIISFVIHHIISDDWSSKIILREIGIIYDSLIKNKPIQLSSPKIQYADFAIWQKKWFDGETLNQLTSYWKNQLNNLPPLVELPYDYNRPSIQTFNGDFKSFYLQDEISNRINEICKNEGITTFMFLIAIFYILIKKLSGQSDICIGTPVANRNRTEIESLVGFFVNTLALRVKINDESSFINFLREVKLKSLDAYSNQDLPFEYLVDIIQPERNLSHSPIFQIMFVFQDEKQNVKTQNLESGLRISTIESHSGTSKFDLTLFMATSNGKLGGAFEYNTDLFSSETIEGYIEKYKNIIREVIENIKIKIREISLSTEKERNILLQSLNRNEVIQVLKGFVHKEIETITEQYPQNIAIEVNDKTYTYYKLNYDSNKIAFELIKNGAKTETVIGLFVERSYESIVGILGILKSGAAYLPIDIKYPESRREYILKDSSAKLLLVSEKSQELIRDLKIKKLNISNLINKDQKDSNNYEINPNVKINEKNLCYLIYTSGSTGNPKGTLLTHEGLINYLSWCIHAYPLMDGKGTILHSTISFDATITSIFPVLLTGGKIIISEETEEIESLISKIKNEKGLSFLKITPAHLEILSNNLEKEEIQNITKSLILGGENLTYSQIETWQKWDKNTLIFNEYGPTETVVGCVVFETHKTRGIGSVPIGKVIPNMEVYVLDNNFEQVPKGVIGELYIGGISLARGYLNKPELTAEKFIPNPYSKNEGKRLYRTGDLVKILNDNNLIFIGRVDTQIKIRGYRIEVTEIEEQLKRITYIKDACVIKHSFSNNDERLIAYLITQNESFDQEELLLNLKNYLPDYMIPKIYVRLEKFPLTINGKIDKKKLPKPTLTRDENKVFIEPSTETEILLASIWAQLLNINVISANDNFFQLGGHSLLVTRLVSRINKRFNTNISLRTIFEYPILTQLSYEIEKSLIEFESKSTIKIEKYERPNQIPLSFNQQRLWFLDKLDPGQSTYNMPMALKVIGQLNYELFEKTISYLIQRHEILRTNFIEIEGIPYQYIKKEFYPEIKIIDLTGQNNIEKKVNNILGIEAKTSFNLSKDQLLRIVLIKIASNENIVSFTMHHIISDGWSVNVLLKDFFNIYISLSTNNSLELEKLKIQYADYALWQRKFLEGDILDKQLKYWVDKLKDGEHILELPIDKKRPNIKTFNGKHFTFNFDENTVNKLHEFATNEGLTPFMVLLCSFQILLSKISGKKDIRVGTPIANRNIIETENLIGFFANTLVMKQLVDGNSNFNQLLSHAKINILQDFENQDVLFEKLVDIIQPERDLRFTPLFQVMFVLQNNDSFKFNATDISIEPIVTETTSTQYDLTLSINNSQNSLIATFEYNTDLFYESTIKRLASHYEFLINNLINNLDKPIGLISYLKDKEIKQLVKINYQPQFNLSQEKSLLDILKKTVIYNSNKIAIEYDEKKITYKDLEKRSNLIAQYLLNTNVRPEEVVGVQLKKQEWLVESMLGIMKAGCIYLPIDPNLPIKRIEFILNDSKCTKIITNKTENNLGKFENLEIIDIDQFEERLNNSFEIERECFIDENSISYIIYTSGSTGTPKGVMINHKGIKNLVLNQIKDFNINDSSRVLLFASISFDASISEIFMSLISSATLVIIKEEKLKEINKLSELFDKHQISTITLPPSLINILDSNKIYSLKTIISAGEELGINIAKKWFNSVNLINAYGPTESSIGVSFYKITLLDEDNIDRIPIGKPLKNIQLYILDEYLNPVDFNVVGELFISGIGLARGYVNNPKMTAEKFIPNPYSKISGERLYKTGDLAKINFDGNIIYIGRKDDQVKLRGYRIELSEIENKLLEIDGIIQAAVIIKGKNQNASLHAFYVPKKEIEFEYDELNNLLSKELPEYMLPNSYVKMISLPLNNSGKIDKRKLIELASNSSKAKSKFIAPSTKTELTVFSIWKELLSVDKFSITESFFELGGNSLLVTQLASRIQANFGIEISIKDLFELTTIQKQSNYISLAPKKTILPKIEKIEKSEYVPLSFAQQRLWVLDNLQESNIMYNINTALRIRGELNIENIKKVIGFLVNDNEILRTNFKLIDKNPVQFVNYSNEFKITEFNFSQQKSDGLNKDIEKILFDNAFEPFDLEHDNLLRVVIIYISNNELILSFTMHHIITDGWSMNLLINQFSETYINLQNGIELTYDNKKLQYSDFSLWQRKYITEEYINSQIDYWKNKLRTSENILELPFDRPRPLQKTFSGDRIFFELSSEIKENVNKISAELNLTPFMVLISFYFILLHKYSSQKIIRLGTPIANRNNFEMENILGFFANTLVMSSEWNDSLTYSEYLTEIKKMSLEAFDNQDVQFEKLVEILEPERNLSLTPIFQAMFILQNNKMKFNKIESDTFQIEPIELNSNKTQFDLSLSMEESLNGYNCWFEYNTDLFNKRTIENYIQHLENIIKQTLFNINISLKRIKLLDNNQESLILDSLSKNIDSSFYQNNVVQLFSEICKQYPNNICITYETKKLTYAQVYERMMLITRYLISQKVKSEDIIGVYLEKGEWLVEVILGILNAGAVYLPIDVNLPEERINYILNDAKVSKLICEKKSISFNVNQIIQLDDIKNYNNESNIFNKYIIDNDNLAYIIYTSGSTGLPKGTMLTHKGLVNLVLNQIHDFGIEKLNNILQFASLSFDASISEIFMSILSGANLVILPDKILKEFNHLEEIFNEYKIDIATIPPSLLTILDYNKFFTLKKIISAGEEIIPNLAEKWLQKKIMFNAYGPTETTIGVTSHKVLEDDLHNSLKVPIGNSLKNVQIFILDENLNLVPDEIVGEIYIGGISLARGYLNKPDLTAENFIPNKYSQQVGERLYKSGDLATINKKGLIEFWGRKDTQCKIRGYRIELGEIESKILDFKDVKEAAVTAFGDGEKRHLVAYLVKKERDIDLNKLKDTLSKLLPSYMIPSKFIILKEIPKNSSGKIDRKKLLQIKDISIIDKKNYVPPKSDTERQLLNIWTKVLNTDKIGINTNFFEVGGNSILAIQLITNIQEEFELDFQMINIFQNPTIKSFATLVELTKNNPEVSTSILVPLNIAANSIPLFLIHPSGGSIHWYTNLAKALGINQSTYGIQAVGIDGKSEPHKTIEDMANYYISVIEKTIAKKPFVIGSWSMGVAIVFEMAQQLRRKRANLQSIIILDQGPINPHSKAEDDAEFLLKMFMGRLEFDLNILRKLEYDEQLKYVLKLAKKSDIFPIFLTFNKFKNYVSILKIQQDAWRLYKPSIYKGDIHLIKSNENKHEYANTELLGWENFVKGKIFLHKTLGDHNTMLHPGNAAYLAGLISKIIYKNGV